jgi:hypothetical protein
MTEKTNELKRELQKPFSRLYFYLIALSSLFAPTFSFEMLITKHGSTWNTEERETIKTNCFLYFKKHFWREFRFFGAGSLIFFWAAYHYGNVTLVFATRCLAAVVVLASISYDISQDQQGAYTESLHQSVTGKIRETFRVLSAFILLLVFATA